MSDVLDRIISYESGALCEGCSLRLFGQLVADGRAWHLQGHYGRGAAALIRDGLLSEAGEVLAEGWFDPDCELAEVHPEV